MFYAIIILIAQAGGLCIVPSVPGDSTPFVIKLDVVGLAPHTVYDCGIWIYGKPSSISQIWTEDGWKGGYRYIYFNSDSIGEWNSYKKMRIVKSPDPYYDYYIKCTIRDTTGFKLIEDQLRHSDGFNIIGSDELGYMEGFLSRDSSFSSPLENVIVIARDTDGNYVGGYVSEDNNVEENHQNTPGYFHVGLPSTSVTSLIIENSNGYSLGQITGEWEVPAHSTINIGQVFPYNIVIPPGGLRVSPTNILPGEDVEIIATIQNTGQSTIQSIPVICYMTKREDKTPSDSITVILDSIPGLDFVYVNMNWTASQEGNYIIKACAGLAEGSVRLRVGDPRCELVINEIMCYPDISEDWVEIYNTTDTSINIKDYKIESPGDILFITREYSFLDGNGFLIICNCSEDCFRTVYGYIPPYIPIIALTDRFPSLRGTSGDTIRIIDSNGFTIDEVRYEKDWIPLKGLSMERINPDITSNIASNWGGCVEKKYGATPGSKNSLYTPYLPTKLRFACTEAFCPTSENKMCFIEYHLPFTKAHVRLYVYDRIGRLVRRILDGDPTGSASYSLDDNGSIIWTHIWDGRDDDGGILPMGAYVIFLEAQDLMSKEVVRDKKSTRLIKDMR